MKHILTFIFVVITFYSSWSFAGRLHGVTTSSIAVAVGNDRLALPVSQVVDGIEDSPIISLSSPELSLYNRNNFAVSVIVTVKALPSSVYNESGIVTYGEPSIARQQINLPAKGQTRLMLRQLFIEEPGQNILALGLCDSDLQNFVASAGATSLRSYTQCASTDFVVDMYWDDESSTSNANAGRYGATRLTYPIAATLRKHIVISYAFPGGEVSPGNEFLTDGLNDALSGDYLPEGLIVGIQPQAGGIQTMTSPVLLERVQE